MIPIGDIGLQRKTIPLITYSLIGVNALVFLYELMLGGSLFFTDSIDVSRFFLQWGLIPSELTGGPELTEWSFLVREGRDVNIASVDIASPVPTWGTAFTSMFIHGGWLHLLGNMLYLWVFGRNIEDRFGHVTFLLFYLGAGLAAVWTHTALNMESQAPLVGASGAIAGVTGAYIVLFPFSRIRTLVLFLFIMAVDMPAILVLGFWFILQLFQGLGQFGAWDAGVAYWAHVGGFVAGILCGLLYKLIRREPLMPGRTTPQDRRNPWDRFPPNYR